MKKQTLTVKMFFFGFYNSFFIHTDSHCWYKLISLYFGCWTERHIDFQKSWTHNLWSPHTVEAISVSDSSLFPWLSNPPQRTFQPTISCTTAGLLAAWANSPYRAATFQVEFGAVASLPSFFFSTPPPVTKISLFIFFPLRPEYSSVTCMHGEPVVQ